MASRRRENDHLHHDHGGDDDDGDDDVRHLWNSKHASPAGQLVMGRDQQNSQLKCCASDRIQTDLANHRVSDTTTAQTNTAGQLDRHSTVTLTRKWKPGCMAPGNRWIFKPRKPGLYIT